MLELNRGGRNKAARCHIGQSSVMVYSHKQHNQEHREGAIDNQEMCRVINVYLCSPGYPGTGSVPS